MPGAGGIVLANHLYNVDAPDGLTLAMPGRSGFLLSNVVPQKGISYDLAKLSYVGGAGSAANALWIRKSAGITSLADLKARKQDLVIGALTARSEDAIAPRLLASYEGWPLKVVTGYAGFQEVLIAVERGEVDGLFTHEGSIQNTRPDMVASGVLRPLVQSFASFPGVPVLADVVANPDAKALLALVTTPSRIGLPLLGPPGIPAERLEILAPVLHAAYGRSGIPRRGGPPRPAGRTRGERRRVAGTDQPQPVVRARAGGQGLHGVHRAQGGRMNKAATAASDTRCASRLH